MKKGEIAEFQMTSKYGYGEKGFPPKIPPHSNLNFEIELVNFYEKQKPKWELELPERINFSQKYKDEGVALFKEKKYKEASEKFEEGYSYVENITDTDVNDELNEKRASLLLNLANCYNNLKDYRNTIDKCDKALLIKENPKCYYYRGVFK